MASQRLLYSLLFVCSVSLLAGCGGSGSGGSSNRAPYVEQIDVSQSHAGDVFAGDTLTASYQYVDQNDDLEAASIIRWLRDGQPIEGANQLSYQVVEADVDHTLTFEIKPVDQQGLSSAEFFSSQEFPVYQRKLMPVAKANEDASDFEVWQLSSSGRMYQVADINPAGSADIVDFFPLGDKHIFSADDGVHGRELWVTQGRAENTQLLKDINVGIGSSVGDFLTSVVFGDIMLFIADDGEHGRELWRTDGSGEGTYLVKDINAEGSALMNTGLMSLGDKVIFYANDGVRGEELWVSDGTTEGTTILQDINVGSGWSGSNFISSYNTIFADKLYFPAKSDGSNSELWLTDGTPEGTSKVLIDEVSVSGYFSRYLKEINNRLCLTLSNELWCSGADGESFNKVDLGETFVSLKELDSFAGSLYAYAQTSSKNGIVRINLSASPSFTHVLNNPNITGLEHFTGLNTDYLFFVKSSDSHDSLWKVEAASDTAVQLFADLTPSHWPDDYYMEYAGKIYFSANQDGLNTPIDLWVTDGTEANTKLHKKLSLDDNDSFPNGFFKFDQKAYFYTDNYQGVYTPTLHVLGETPETTLPYVFDESVFQKRHFK